MTKPAQTIIPHLWFEKEAHEAAQYYVCLEPTIRRRHRIDAAGQISVQ